MKYLQFTIENYRAIKKGSVAVSNNLIPIIGINESGKTTLLQAILAFDKNKDRYNKGLHLLYKNKYELKERDCKISAQVMIEDKSDIEFLSKNLSLTLESPLLKLFESYFNTKRPITLSRDLATRKYKIEDEEFESVTKKNELKNAASALYEKLPFILYFDDFSDRVPKSISFPLIDGKKLTDTKSLEEWHSIIEEIFKRATNGDQSLSDFLVMKNKDDQKGLMSDIIDTLDNEVVEDWKNLKRQYGQDFADESEDLKLKVDWQISEDNSSIVFEFQVEDRTANKKGRFFNIAERSKGFQWFFNFIMKLKFNPKYQENEKGAIYLLDEPGSYLHTSAQEELLKKLKDISDTNPILYCTHSQYLLDPDVINIAKIKIARKENGKIEAVPFDEAGVSKSDGALTPLYQALHLKAGNFERSGKYCVITEGITDFYLFNIFKKLKPNSFLPVIDFIPGAGASYLKDLISNAIAFSKQYMVLLDSDKAGRTAFDTYTKYFGEEEAKKFFKYRTTKKQDDVVLENLISEADKTRLKDCVKINDIKAAIPVLYYMSEQVQKDFIKGLGTETLGNMKILEDKINSIVSK